jgi:hypothetical protein
MGRRRAGCLLLFAALAVLAAGCSSRPRPRPLEFGRGTPGAVRVVVAPLNLTVQLAPDLEDAVDPVSAEVIRYLQFHGARVAVIWPSDAWDLWRDAAAAVQAKGGDAPALAQVAAVFSHALARHADYDLVVFPSLVYRDARVTGRFAHWDGVRRRIRFRARSGAPVGRAQPIPDPIDSTDRSAAGAVVPEWRGRITGLSLHALVFTPEGRGVFQGVGGLDLVHDAVREREGSPEPPVLHLHANLLENIEHVREGIALALDPYLAKNRSR